MSAAVIDEDVQVAGLVVDETAEGAYQMAEEMVGAGTAEEFLKNFDTAIRTEIGDLLRSSDSEARRLAIQRVAELAELQSACKRAEKATFFTSLPKAMQQAIRNQGASIEERETALRRMALLEEMAELQSRKAMVREQLQEAASKFDEAVFQSLMRSLDHGDVAVLGAMVTRLETLLPKLEEALTRQQASLAHAAEREREAEARREARQMEKMEARAEKLMSRAQEILGAYGWALSEETRACFENSLRSEDPETRLMAIERLIKLPETKSFQSYLDWVIKRQETEAPHSDGRTGSSRKSNQAQKRAKSARDRELRSQMKGHNPSPPNNHGKKK